MVDNTSSDELNLIIVPVNPEDAQVQLQKFKNSGYNAFLVESIDALLAALGYEEQSIGQEDARVFSELREKIRSNSERLGKQDNTAHLRVIANMAPIIAEALVNLAQTHRVALPIAEQSKE